MSNRKHGWSDSVIPASERNRRRRRQRLARRTNVLRLLKARKR